MIFARTYIQSRLTRLPFHICSSPRSQLSYIATFPPLHSLSSGVKGIYKLLMPSLVSSLRVGLPALHEGHCRLIHRRVSQTASFKLLLSRTFTIRHSDAGSDSYTAAKLLRRHSKRSFQIVPHQYQQIYHSKHLRTNRNTPSKVLLLLSSLSSSLLSLKAIPRTTDFLSWPEGVEACMIPAN